MAHLEHIEVPKKFRILHGAKHAFFTNHHYNEVIIPELKGVNTMPLKTYEKKFAYSTGHICSVLIRNCRDWNVPVESVTGNTPMEGAQDHHYLYTHLGLIRINTLLRGGILFLNGDYFGKAYFVCPTLEDYNAALIWLRQLGNILRP